MESELRQADDLAWLSRTLSPQRAVETGWLLQDTSALGLVGKDSSGKSTLATAAAVLAAQHRMRVLLIDGDLQNRSITEWSILRQAAQNVLRRRLGSEARLAQVDVAVISGRGMMVQPFAPKGAENLNSHYDLVIFDFSGAPSEARSQWLRLCSLVLLPIEPSAICALATRRILADCRTLGAEPIGLINKSTRGPRALEAKAALEMQGLEFAPSIRNYVAHQDAAAAGLSVVEVMPRHSASDDLRQLHSWSMQRLGLDETRGLTQLPAYASASTGATHA